MKSLTSLYIPKAVAELLKKFSTAFFNVNNVNKFGYLKYFSYLCNKV